jgi:rhomboid protease GluP
MASDSPDLPVSKQNPNTVLPAPQSLPRSTKMPWITWLAIAACVVIYIGLAAENNYKSWNTLTRWGYLPAFSIWEGAYWGLFTSVFVHFAIWHLAFNVYWLWALGSVLERTIGSFRYLAFFVVSAFVSSTFQLDASDNVGIGASGVVYAIFGFMLVSRNLVPQFKQILSPQIINIFLIWLAGCFFATYLKIWEVGNAAHMSGLVFGSLVAGYFMVRYKPVLTFSGLSFLIILTIIPLFWCPWSVTWLSIKARNAQIEQKYAEAIERYTQILQLDNENAWAYYNRGRIYEYLDKPELAEADLEQAKRLGYPKNDTD